MTRFVLIDAILVDVSVPRGLDDPSVDAIRSTLNSARFHRALAKVLRDLFERYPSLRTTRVRVTR